jgi:hypothetical protein
VSRFRDFDAAVAESEGEPLTFKLGGETLRAPADIPAGPVLKLARSAESGGAAAVEAFSTFLDAIVVPEDREALGRALDVVGISVLIDVVGWVVEESFGVPLPSASSSVASLPLDGAQSNPDSSPADAIPSG